MSRVPNKVVLQKAAVLPLTEQILRRQFVILRKVAAAPGDSVLRKDTFKEDSLVTQVGFYVRRRGRPRQDWASELIKLGVVRFGGRAVFERLLMGSETDWTRALDAAFQVKKDRDEP